MRAPLLLAALAFAAGTLAFLPAASAAQLPPPCYTMTTCCPMDPSFAPCCSVLECPPPVARCPDLDVDTSAAGPFRAPWVSAETDPDCSANACVNTSDCSDAACQAGDHFCCSLQGTLSFCTSLQGSDACVPPLASAAAMQATLPIPRLSVVQNADCTFTVYGTIDSCPNGFLKDTVHLTVGAVHFAIDECVPQCACIPLEAGLVLPEGFA